MICEFDIDKCTVCEWQCLTSKEQENFQDNKMIKKNKHIL